MTHQTTIAREEFFIMKCCSYKRKDLEKHYNNMSKRFYLLKEMNDPNLKQTHLNSLPNPLSNEAFKLLETNGITLQNASLGEIYQNALFALEKLCDQKKFLHTFEEMRKKISTTCDRKDLSIRCKYRKGCLLPSYKNKHFRKRILKVFPNIPNLRNSRRKNGSSYQKRGSEEKQAPDAMSTTKQTILQKNFKTRKEKFFQHLQYANPEDFSNVESVFSLKDEYTPDTLFTIQVPIADSDHESSSSEEQFKTYGINGIFATSSPSYHTQPVHAVQIQIRLSTYANLSKLLHSLTLVHQPPSSIQNSFHPLIGNRFPKISKLPMAPILKLPKSANPF